MPPKPYEFMRSGCLGCPLIPEEFIRFGALDAP
jgi:hypothetical protein